MKNIFVKILFINFSPKASSHKSESGHLVQRLLLLFTDMSEDRNIMAILMMVMMVFSLLFLQLQQILIWNLEIGEPVKMIDCHTDVILSMSFNTDGSLLATSCKDKKMRVIEPRSGAVMQVRGGNTQN